MKNIPMQQVTTLLSNPHRTVKKQICLCTVKKSYLTLIFTVAYLILERKDHCLFMPYFLCDNKVNGNANLFLYQAITSKLANPEKWNLTKTRARVKCLRSL